METTSPSTENLHRLVKPIIETQTFPVEPSTSQIVQPVVTPQKQEQIMTPNPSELKLENSNTVLEYDPARQGYNGSPWKKLPLDEVLSFAEQLSP